MVQDIVLVHVPVAARCSRKSIRERLGCPGLVRDDDADDFHGLGTLDKAIWTVQDPWVRADAQC